MKVFPADLLQQLELDKVLAEVERRCISRPGKDRVGLISPETFMNIQANDESGRLLTLYCFYALKANVKSFRSITSLLKVNTAKS